MKTEAPSRPKKKHHPDAVCGRCGEMVEAPCRGHRDALECIRFGGHDLASEVAKKQTTRHNPCT